MVGFFYNLLSYIDGLGVYGVFAVSLIAVFVTFAVAFFCALFIKGNLLKKRVWYFAAISGICGVQLGLSLIFGYGVGFCVISLSVGVLLSVPVFCVKKREKASEEQRELARFIDGQIKRAKAGDCEPHLEFGERNDQSDSDRVDFSESVSDEKDFQIPAPCAGKNDPPKTTAVNVKNKKSEARACEIDFTHVKNVIARLEYFPLGQSDRKQIKDLETSVFMAENGDYTPQLKGKINDGLGSLLKIMAKYGV